MCFCSDVSAVFIYQITIYVGLISSISFSLFTDFSTLISFFVDRLVCIFEFDIMIVRSRLRKLLHTFFRLQLIFLEVGGCGTCFLTWIIEEREYVFKLQFSTFPFSSPFLSPYSLYKFSLVLLVFIHTN